MKSTTNVLVTTFFLAFLFIASSSTIAGKLAENKANDNKNIKAHFFKAIESKKANGAKKIIKNKQIDVNIPMTTNLDQKDALGHTPLYSAVVKGEIDMVRKLLKNKTLVDDLALHLAANKAVDKAKNTILKLLLMQDSANLYALIDGKSLLEDAVLSKNLDAVKSVYYFCVNDADATKLLALKEEALQLAEKAVEKEIKDFLIAEATRPEEKIKINLYNRKNYGTFN